MSRQLASRNLSLTEELEHLEQSITRCLQDIDANFSKAHRIVSTSILPIIEQYAKHSNGVWEGSKFWKQFFEASANVSLSGYEENVNEEDITHTDSTSTALDTPSDHGGYAQQGAQEQEDEDEFEVDSPTQVTGLQTTPRLPSTTKKTNGKAPVPLRSPSPRKYTGKNPLAMDQSPEDPSTPRPQTYSNVQSSPFEPESAYQASAQLPRTNNDPLMHRSVLDKNYRVQATPHTQRRQRQAGPSAATAAAAKPTPSTASKRLPWDDSPHSSPAIAAPQLRSDLFSPTKPSTALNLPRTPGVSILTPARNRPTTATGPGAASTTTATAAPTTSTGGQLFSPQDKTYSATKSNARSNSAAHIFSSDDDDDSDDGDGELSPPKTMQFFVPQSRLLQTPAREASKRIVEDLLLTAGAGGEDDTMEEEEIEGIDDPSLVDEPSPSIVRRGFEDDTF